MSRPVVIAAGGTGGHMFPALALARELQGRGQEVALACDARGARYLGPDLRHHEIRAASPSGPPLRRLLGLARLGAGLAQAIALLRRERPAAVAVFGGYASVPVGLAARLLEDPAPGARAERRARARQPPDRAPRRPARADLRRDRGARAARIPSVVTGNPVRPEVVALRERPYRAPERDGPLDLVVVGGSQGARVLSEALPAALACLPKAARARIRLTQQCRPEDLERVASAYAGLGFAAELKSFYDDLPERLARAHLVVSRSGASSVAELLVLGRPALLVPYRFAADDHQRANAQAVVQAGAGWLIEEAALDGERLAARLSACLDQPQELAVMAARAHALGRPDAARALADALESLISPVGRESPSGGAGMRTLPIDAGGIHFVGIGGIGMSGIAEVLHNLGHRVQGSDIAENANIERLRGLGIPVAIGHRAANLGECGVVVVSSAVKGDNAEIEAARGARVPVVRRAEMLGELMRLKWAIAVAGTHGKTTTTSLIAALLDAAKLDPTVINGGIINAYGTNARSGARATGWWSRPTSSTAPSSACRRASRWSPTSTPSTWTSTAPSTPCARPFRASSRTSRSTASPRSASTTPRSRRCSAGSPTAA